MYKYTEQRPNLFTEEGMLVVMKIRDNVRELLAPFDQKTLGVASAEIPG